MNFIGGQLHEEGAAFINWKVIILLQGYTVPAGRIFIFRMIGLSKSSHPIIPLTIEAQLDIQWWINFLPRW